MEKKREAIEQELLEQELLEQARQAIKAMLDSLPDKKSITLNDMEEATGKLGQSIMHKAMQSLVEAGNKANEEAVICPDCQARMTRRGQRKRWVMTKRGEIEIERQYYVCPQCRNGHFPP
jgi:Zn finger protein HypA/HybF involved in hydrogenase expression